MALFCASGDVTRQPECANKDHHADSKRKEPFIPAQDVGKYQDIKNEAGNNQQPAEKLQPRGGQRMYAVFLPGIPVIGGDLIQGAIEFVFQVIPCDDVLAAFKETFKKPFFILVKIISDPLPVPSPSWMAI